MRIRSISAKFIVGFLLIFSLSFLLLNQIVANVIRTSNEKIVTDNLVALKKTSNGYVRQAFLINHFTNDDLYFGQMAKEIVNDLHFATSSQVSAYSVTGQLLASSDPSTFADRPTDDLKHALDGSTAYTITYDSGSANVLFSYPVIIDGVKVGILRYAKPFDLLYEQTFKIMDTIFYIALAIFAAAFLFSYLLSRHITIPLVKLAKASEEVTGGNLNVRLRIRRRDEIGRLAGNFDEMIRTIRSQIDRIERDRDRLENVNRQRKLFFDNVTHELKTPLTSILGYAELIRENGESDKAFFRKGMKHIVDESKRLHGMVLNLLEASQGERAGSLEEVERIDAGQVARDVSESLAFKAQRYKKTIRCDAQERLFVRAQSDKLRQLFINLLDNAIKYGAPRSEISLRGWAQSDAVRFVIANRGETIPKEQLDRIFEPFYIANNGDKEPGSLGLGLNIAKSIVQDLEGTIRIESERGWTSVFVDLPLRISESEA